MTLMISPRSLRRSVLLLALVGAVSGFAVSCGPKGDIPPPATAIPAIEPTADEKVELARQLIDGDGRRADPAKGAAMLEPLAKDGHPEAQYLLGFAYREGRGVKRDPVRAVNLFENAAIREHAQAAFLAGQAYEDGDVVPANPEKAAAYLKIAADGGVVDAFYRTAVALDEGNGLTQDRAKAIRYYEKAAESGHLDSILVVAKAYETGDAIPKDLAWALRWHERAADHGVLESQYTFGTMIWAGNGLPVNQSEGLKWLLIASKAGYRQAQKAIPRHRSRMSRGDSSAAREGAREWQVKQQGVPQGVDKPTVRFLQAALNQMGIPAGGVDGKNGPSIRRAVNNFRLIHGQQQAQEIDLETVYQIREERLRRTSRQASN